MEPNSKKVKGLLLTAGTMLLSAGTTLISTEQYVVGTALAVGGAICFGVREIVKDE